MGLDSASYSHDIEYAHAGMIDWLTLKIDMTHLSAQLVQKLRSMSSRLCKINPDGTIDWEAFCFESVRSDTHQVTIRAGSDLQIQGSPARVGLPNNVFGSLDIRYCAQKMIDFAANHLVLGELPALQLWSCTRIDVTTNYLLSSLAEAQQVLSYLKQAPESRQKHSYESHGFYIGKGSTLHHGKIYLKGQDARRNNKSGRAHYTQEQLDKADRLLRAEYCIRRHMLSRLKDDDTEWYQLTPQRLFDAHTNYFKDYFSEIEVVDMGNILEKLLKVAETEGQGKAAYDCYVRIRLIGYEQSKSSYPKTSWYRHIKNLKAAGLTRADLNPINVLPLRKKSIEVREPVRHWDEISVA